MSFWCKLTYRKSGCPLYGLLLVWFTMVSCEWVTSKQPTKEQLVKQEIKNIDWNDLDRYPLFETCDETADKPVQKACFETTFTEHLEMTLQQYRIVVHQSVHDTVWMNFHIDNKGNLSILTIENSGEATVDIPEIDSIFKSSIELLPRLHPPLKRDIPVAAKFKLPIVLYVE